MLTVSYWDTGHRVCGCGCGGRTNIAVKTKRERGHVRGLAMPFLPSHTAPHPLPEYIEDSNGCWVWQRARSKGYGVQKAGGQQLFAHRIYYERLKGPIPEGLQIDHRCRNRACVNPDHLEAVTPLENLRRRPTTKLTNVDVRAIRAATGLRSEIAAAFGVHEVYVSKIRSGAVRADA